LQSVKDTGLTGFAVVKHLSFRWNDESLALNFLSKKSRIRLLSRLPLAIHVFLVQQWASAGLTMGGPKDCASTYGFMISLK